MLHQTHARVTWPTLLVIVADDILVVGIGMLRQVALNQVTCFLGAEPASGVTLSANKS